MRKFFDKLKSQLKFFENSINEYTLNVHNLSNPAQSYVEWAKKLLAEGKEDIAIEKLETVTEMGIQNPEAYVNLALTYIKHGEFDKVPRLLKTAISVDSQYAKAYLAYGVYHSELKEFDKAEYYYSISAKLDPRQPDVYVNWAVSLVSQHKQQEAQEKFKKAMFYNPHNLVGLYLWAVLDIEMEKYQSAREKLAVVLSFQPKTPDAMISMAYIYYKEKNYHLAIEFAKCAMEVCTDKAQLYDFLADSYCSLDNYEKALEIYEMADKKEFKDEKLYLNWGKNAFVNKDFVSSIRAYKIALKINSASIDAKLGVAANEIVKNELSNARVLLNEVLEFVPQNTVALLNLYEIEKIEKNYNLAINYLYEAIKCDVSNVKYYFDLGLLYECVEDFEKAKQSYAKVFEYNPENIEVYYRYACLIIEENPKEALRKIRVAYNKDKENLSYIKFYAKALCANEQYQNALDVIEKALYSVEDKTELFYIKVLTLLNVKKFNDAIDILYGLPQDKKDNEEFDYLLLWAYILRANTTKFQADINEMNDFSYYLSQKYSKNNEFVVKLKKLADKYEE